MGKTKYYALSRFTASLYPEWEDMAYSPYYTSKEEYYMECCAFIRIKSVG